MTRRSLRILAATTLTAFAVTGCTPSDDSAEAGSAAPNEGSTQQAEVTAKLKSLEKDFDAKVGVSAVDTTDGTTVDHRASERFGFASSLKVFAVAELLDRTTPEELDKRVTWSQADVDQAGWTPVTEKHVDDGLPLEEVAEAALRVSDNAAMNIVLDEIGGPEGLDAALEVGGDATTAVVDEEPDLNDVEPGSTDNTTTPEAFTTRTSRGLLRSPNGCRPMTGTCCWSGCRTTRPEIPLIRAGAPEGWTVKDKSGHSDGIQNDIAVVSPPGEDPIVVSVLTEIR
jgi:beta-lactamase class A